MKVVKFEMNFEDIRNIIRKNNSSEYGKQDNPIVLFPSDVNNITNEILGIHKEKPFYVYNVRNLLNQLHREEISFSRMVEIMNEMALKQSTTPTGGEGFKTCT